MNIGIITYHDANNVGAVLQAYALQFYLEKLGHNAEFIDYNISHEKLFLHIALRYYCMVREAFCSSWKGAVYNSVFMKSLHVGKKKYTSIRSLRASPPKYDLYITGSDQIWILQGGKKFDPAFFLDFLPPGSRKISYAASLGEGIIPKSFHPELSRFLSTFAGISVREEDSISLLTQITESKKEIVHVVDPTFLLSTSIYLKLMDSSSLLKEDYIGAYLLKKIFPEQHKLVKFIAQKMKMPIVRMRNPESCVKLGEYQEFFVTPEKFLACVFHSSFMICASFHAVVFSLLFRKPFIVIEAMEFVKKGGGNKRIRSLLSSLGLLNRCFHSFDEQKILDILSTPINWDQCDEILSKFANNSKQWLHSHLNV